MFFKKWNNLNLPASLLFKSYQMDFFLQPNILYVNIKDFFIFIKTSQPR